MVVVREKGGCAEEQIEHHCILQHGAGFYANSDQGGLVHGYWRLGVEDVDLCVQDIELS